MPTINGNRYNTDRDTLICIEQLKLLYGGVPLAVTAQVLSGLLVLVVEWSITAHSILLGWFVAVLIINLGRAALAMAYRRHPAGRPNQAWRRYFIIAAGLSGFSWASAGILLFPADNLSHQTFVGFAMVGMATGAVATQSFLRQAMFAFVIPIMLGLSAGFFLNASPIGMAIAAAALLLLSVLLMSGNRIYHSTLQNIELRLKSAEQSLALQHSEQRLRTILDTEADAFLLHDMQGRFVEANQQACNSLGYSREELLALSVADIELTTDMANVQAHWDDLDKGGAVTINGFHRRKTGSVFPVEVRLGVLYEHGEKLISVLARDVSERQQAEATLKLREEQARAQYKGIPLPTYTWQLRGDDFELIDYNDAAAEFTRGIVADYLGSKLADMYANEQHIQDAIWQCYRQQASIQRQMPYHYHSMGEIRHLDVKYAFVPPDMVMIHTEDITDRIRAENELREKQSQLQEAQRIARLGNWDWDLATGKIEWSDEIFRILGYEKGRDEANQENFIKAMHPDDLALMAESEQRAFRGEPHFDEEWRVITPEGEIRYVHLRGDRYFNEEKQPIRMVGTMQDVTERKQVEILKSEFISTVSHEIRTPLTSIMGSLSIIRGGMAGPLSEDAAKMLRIAYENSQRLLVLINDILDISKIESGSMAFDFKPVGINHFLELAISANQGYAEHHHVHYSFDSELDEQVMVLGDGDRLMQVMNNLLSNAAKFSPRGSDIDVTAYQRENNVYITVADRGPGIPADFVHKVFERFTQHDASNQRISGGTGLGLNISRHIVARHQGSIGFDARPGGGTVFYFSLPLLQIVTAHAAN